MQIISRTVSILEEVARRPDGGGLVEIANACSLPAATCHRLLAALGEDELVHRDPLTRRYSVGPGLVQLAGMVTQIGRGASIEAGMTALRDRWRECFFLASVVDDAIICVRSLPTVDPNRMTVTVPLGQPMTPNAAGSGKAILAHVPPEQRRRLIAAGGGMASLTENSIIDQEDFEAEMNLIRERGHAICDEEAEIGAATVAVPILVPEGSVRSALATIGPRNRILALAEEGLIEDMERTAAMIAGLEQGTIVDALVPGI
ncbi:MAG: IclR family transcriptional regulator [Actinobacteria bacterium]|nr:IclR family transcriptional regulator [Actinomycetota bacterium]